VVAGPKGHWLVIGLIAVGGGLPIFHYWYFIGQAPAITPLETNRLLAAPGSTAVLADVRTPEVYNKGHLAGALNWPYRDIRRLARTEALPGPFVGKTVLLICDGGVSSALAAQRLRHHFGVDARSVTGGIQSWIAAAAGDEAIPLTFSDSSGEALPPPIKKSPLGEQAALATAVRVIKPLYMLIALGLIGFLWRLQANDLKALRRGLAAFLAGETTCAFNIVFFHHSNYLLEYFHMFGMVVGFGFFFFSVTELLDARVIGYSDPQKRCVLLGMCRRCGMSGEAPCGLRQAFYFLLPSLAALTVIPVLAKLNPISYNTTIFGLRYNYSHPLVYQIFETRYVPVYALILFLGSLAAMRLTRDSALTVARILFAAGMGALSFGFLRVGLWGIYHESFVWPNFWEELTELIFVTGVGVFLWLFRRGLFLAEDLAEERTPAQ
jgi:rhodanese-related sulfurtransferase